jgi:hypothetical protein
VRDAGKRPDRLASRNGLSIVGQSEALILLGVVVVCFCGMGVACVRGSPAGMDAGGAESGWVAISQQKPLSSRAIATATTPLGLWRAS